MTTETDTARDLLRHMLATLAYRGGKTLRDTGADFATFRASEKTRTPLEILAHIGVHVASRFAFQARIIASAIM